MSENLKQKTTKGVLWSSIERFSNQGVQFIFGIILARILSPKEYGIVAMVTVFFAVSQTFIEGGFGAALIRKKDRTDNDMSTCFWFNVGVGIFFYILLFLTAPFIAQFYKQPILEPIIKVSGFEVIFYSFCIVQQTRFIIKVDFKRQARITIFATLISGLTGIILAYLGYGVWSLVIQGILCAFLQMILLWVMSKWIPNRRFSIDSFKYLWGFGSKMLISGLLDTLYNNIYPIIIGKFYSPAQLGNFARAQGWAGFPSNNLTSILQRVTFPVLSEIQDDDERFIHSFRRILRMSSFIVFPLMLGLAAVSSPLVRVVVTSKWDGCTPLLQIICFALMWYPVHAINLNLLQIKGRSDLFLRLIILKIIVGLGVMCFTIPIGITAMCVGMVISSLLTLKLDTYYTGKFINWGFFRQLRDLFPIFLNSLIMGILVYLSIYYIHTEWIKLFAGCCFGFVFYITGAYFLSKSELKEVIHIIRGK
ncbi:lipopolysaccharide biosynthesis protein [Prevotella pallens]|uniref:lipopolysaccharide biosynthesis protein n=1 Tax=Prevotella pallens TaxID=60133 RepID=UPI0028EFA16A|nr:lipopolysaccharide biosynthesis protein [Prevotella pallens]